MRICISVFRSFALGLLVSFLSLLTIPTTGGADPVSASFGSSAVLSLDDNLCPQGAETYNRVNSALPSNCTPFTVSSTEMWQNTGVYVTAGDLVSITASGAITTAYCGGCASEHPYRNPDGCDISALPNCNTLSIGYLHLCQNANVGYGLVGKIAESGECFQVGSEYSATATESGEVWLAFNDGIGSFGDNHGSFDACISTTSGSSEPDNWCDGFESYSSPSDWSTTWHGSGNVSGITVDNTYAYSGANSLKMFGLLGSCWGSVVTRSIAMTLPMQITLAVRNGTEPLSGCHPYRATVGLRTGGPDWWNCPCPQLLQFMPNGDIRLPLTTGGPTDFSGFALNTWHELKFELTLPGDGFLHVTAWANGSMLDDFTIPEEAWMTASAYLDLASQEGTVWFDDVCMGPLSESEFVEVAVDIKPGSCPNPLNIRPYSKGTESIEPGADQATSELASYGQPQIQALKAVLPVAVLGTSDFAVTSIDPSTVVLAGVSPLRWAVEDVATPLSVDASDCACTSEGADGYADLTLKFGRDEIVAAIGSVNDGDVVTISLSGVLYDGTPIQGTDCVIIIGSKTIDDSPVLVGNYPNPFNPSTEISFSLPSAGEVRLEVFNMLGQRVATLVSGQMEAGNHTVTWDASDQASGVYLYRLAAGTLADTKKMLLLK